MNIQRYSDAIKFGELTEREAKKKAYRLGLTDLTLNQNGIWVAYDENLNLIRVTTA